MSGAAVRAGRLGSVGRSVGASRRAVRCARRIGCRSGDRGRPLLAGVLAGARTRRRGQHCADGNRAPQYSQAGHAPYSFGHMAASFARMAFAAAGLDSPCCTSSSYARPSGGSKRSSPRVVLSKPIDAALARSLACAKCIRSAMTTRAPSESNTSIPSCSGSLRSRNRHRARDTALVPGRHLVRHVVRVIVDHRDFVAAVRDWRHPLVRHLRCARVERQIVARCGERRHAEHKR